MENISQLGTKVSEPTTHPDILIISPNFSPRNDAMGEYVYNRCLQDPDRVILMAAGCSGDKVFDEAQQFPIYRWSSLIYWHGILLGNLFNSVSNIIFSLLLAIRLYFRYHYRYIEWFYGYNFPSLLILSYILPIRFFIYLHGHDLDAVGKNPCWRSLFKLTLNRSQGIICQSSYIRDSLRTRFRLDVPTHVINPVVRPEKFAIASSLSHLQELRQQTRQLHNIPETAFVLLSVGRLVKHQSFDRVIDNIPLLLTIGVDVHYLLCGTGSCEPKLKSLAEKLRVDQRIHFAGFVPEGELAGYYAACDILAMLTAQDSLDMVCLDAGYFSKPVIASRLGMNLDVIRHGETGLLVNPDSGYEVLQAFKRLAQDQQFREKLGRQGKELTQRKNYHRWLYSPESKFSCLLN